MADQTKDEQVRQLLRDLISLNAGARNAADRLKGTCKVESELIRGDLQAQRATIRTLAQTLKIEY